MAEKKPNPKKFEDLTGNELVKKFAGTPTLYHNGSYFYEPQYVATAVCTLTSMVKERNVEIAYLKDKVAYLEQLINLVFKDK